MKEGQIIISVEREFGSGGRDIAHLLGHYFNIPVYHHSLLEKIGIHEDYDLEELRESFDETPRNLALTRTVRGMTNSNSKHIAEREFALLKKMAAQGQSYIIIGHCGEAILKEYGVISLFISGDKAMRLERTMSTFGEDAKQARKHIKKMDKTRRAYHNHYCPDHKWGDARYYDLSINSTRLGIDATARFLEKYITLRINNRNRITVEEA